MNINFRLFVFSLGSCFANISYATTGGPEQIEVLGFDRPDNKIYFTRNFYDESARPPMLYYFLLKNKNNNKPVKVKSIYQKLNNIHDSDQAAQIENEIQTIKSRLVPLKRLVTTNTSITIKNKQKDIGHYRLNANELSTTKYTQHYIVNNQKYVSGIQKSISYSTPRISILSLYHLSNSQTINNWLSLST